MAKAKDNLDPEAVVARGADVPLAIAATGPRDALLDPREGDIIPDLEEKGYHVGTVAQPAEPVLHRSGDVTYESLPEAPASRFEGLTLAEQKAAHNEREANDPAYAGVLHVPDTDSATARPDDRLPATARSTGPVARTTTGPAESTTGDLDRSSARVASAQAAEDKR